MNRRFTGKTVDLDFLISLVFMEKACQSFPISRFRRARMANIPASVHTDLISAPEYSQNTETVQSQTYLKFLKNTEMIK